MANNQQADNQKFSCAVCFDDFSVAEKVLCGFDGAEAERHSFCHKCIVGHATASAEDAQLADGGFRCMEHGCKNPIAYSVAIQKLLPKNIKERLDERMMEENLAKSGLILERCRDCNFGAEMIQSKEENKVFPCLKCRKLWCRICGRQWNQEHKNLTCAQMDARNNIDSKQRELERKLNEAVIRTCECGLQFTKADGCNKMTCRCGRTQCYICRKKNVDYNHFCRHIRDPACQCGDKCILWADANKIDQIALDRIHAEAAKDGINLNNVVKPNPPQYDNRQILLRENEIIRGQFQRVLDDQHIREADMDAGMRRQRAQQREQQLALERALREAQHERDAAAVQRFVQAEQERAQQLQREALRQAAQQRQQAEQQLEEARLLQAEEYFRRAALQREQERQLQQERERQAVLQREEALRQAALQRQQAALQRERERQLQQAEQERERQAALQREETTRQAEQQALRQAAEQKASEERKQTLRRAAQKNQQAAHQPGPEEAQRQAALWQQEFEQRRQEAQQRKEEAEQRRQEAERRGQEAEQRKEEAERRRQVAEQRKQDAERRGDAPEQRRQEAERKRQEAERKRQEVEQRRQEAERKRQENERKRLETEQQRFEIEKRKYDAALEKENQKQQNAVQDEMNQSIIIIDP